MLRLLVVKCFEFFGFPVKCAEASWLLEFSFMEPLLIAVTLDTDIVISGVQNISFGMPGASTLAPLGSSLASEEHLGGASEQQG